MEEKKKKAVGRNVGIDLGKKTYEAAFVDGNDKVALEVCAMAFIMAKEIKKAVGCRVYVLNPCDKEMRRRKLLASYRRTQQSRNRNINQLHALFVSQSITTMVRKDLIDAENRQEAILMLDGCKVYLA